MSTMKTYVAVWLMGWITGLITAERWRTMGVGYAQATTPAGVVETGTASTPTDTSPPKPKVSAAIVAGAKTDYARARNRLERHVPWVKPRLAGLHLPRTTLDFT
jgi:hypothetical protein